MYEIKVYQSSKISGTRLKYYEIKLPKMTPCTNQLKNTWKILWKTFLIKKVIRTKASLKKKLLHRIDVTPNNISAVFSELFDKRRVFTYCLFPQKLVIVDTGSQNYWHDLYSKHAGFCSVKACVAGEMRFSGNIPIFDLSSGTFRPTKKHIENMRKRLPKLKIKIKTRR